jgi:hypothetical protein
MARDVFISHSGQDKEVAATICAALEAAAIPCWVAPRDVRAGKSFPGEITRAIQQSKVMLLIFSRHSNGSEQVLREVQLAADCHLPIVRLRIEDVTLSDDLRYYLSTPHWLDALSAPLSKHIPALVTAIRELLMPAAPESGAAPSATTAARDKKFFTKWTAFAFGTALFLLAALALATWAWRPKEKMVDTPATGTPTPAASPIVANQAAAIATPPATPTATAVHMAIVPSPTAAGQIERASPAEPSSEPADSTTDSQLTRITNTRYGFSALIPPNVFPIPQATFAADRQTFRSYDGRADLTFYVEPNSSPRHLRASYEQWAAEHTKAEPDKIVDYKVIRDNWFVVSGQKGGRGFYLKAVAKRDILQFMYLDCDANRYPVNGTMLKAMSRAFDGN